MAMEYLNIFVKSLINIFIHCFYSPQKGR